MRGLAVILLHEDFEVARRQAQIEIQLAEIVVIVGVDRFVAGIKRVNDAGPDRPPSAIASGDDFDPVVLAFDIRQEFAALRRSIRRRR